MPPEVAPPSLPDHLRVLAPLGHGRGSSLWAADDLAAGRPVAVRQLDPDLARRDAARTAFLDAARRAQALAHVPHAIRVHEVGEHDGRPFLTMDRLGGQTLADVLAGPPPGRATILRWLREAATALDAAHESGTVHGDLRADALLLDDRAEVVVCDFGVAAALAAEGGLGTPSASHVAPEQRRGEPPVAATDEYALAVVAQALLEAGGPDSAPPELGFVMRIALHEDPTRRWRTCGLLVSAIETVFAARPSSTESPAQTVPAAPGKPAVREARAPEEAVARDEATAAREETAEPEAESPAQAAAGDASLPEEARPGAPPPQVPSDSTAPPRSRPGDAGRAGARHRGRTAAGVLAAGLVATAGVLAALLLPTPDEGRAPVARDTVRPAPTARAPSAPPPPPERTPEPPRERTPEPSVVPAPATDPSPGAARRLTSRGYALLRAGDPEPAIPVFRRAARLSAEDSITYASSLFGLGRSLRLAGRPEEALEVLERRVELPPRTSNSQRELAAARVAASAIDER